MSAKETQKQDDYWRFIAGDENTDSWVKQSKDNKFLLIREYEQQRPYIYQYKIRLEKLED